MIHPSGEHLLDALVEEDRLATDAPSVSVIITTYDHAHYLADSIGSCLSQQHPDLEVIVVDDGSNDDPEVVVRRYPEVRYLRKPNGGLSSARNAGLAAATGTFVLFLDADDWLLPGALHASTACLARRPEAGFVAGGHRYALADRSCPAHMSQLRFPIGAGAGTMDVERGYRDLVRLGNHVGMHGAVMYRRSALEACGAFDETLRTCEDYDVLLKVAQRFPVAYHTDLVAVYRRHDVSMSSDPAPMLRDTLLVLRRQRRYCRRDRDLQQAYVSGVDWVRTYYGGLLLRSFARELGRLRFQSALVRFLLALRHAPRFTVRHSVGQLSRVRLRHLPWAVRGIALRLEARQR